MKTSINFGSKKKKVDYSIFENKQQSSVHPFDSIDYESKTVEEGVCEELKVFKQSKQDEQKRFVSNTETTYYFITHFDSETQRNDFLNKIGIDKKELDEIESISGKKLAEKLNIQLIEGTHPKKVKFATNNKFNTLT